ncbi:MAG TPA: CTP synthase, partial [Saprospiraceae bacterium]|nr:CTP synthase [Saprospiraceae bacterium]
TQHSVKELLQTGIQPDILVCRTEHSLSKEIREKLALFCNVEKEAVIEAIDAPTIYDVPILMLKEKLDRIVLKRLNLKHKNEPDLTAWKEFLGKLKNPTREVEIALVGKYNELPDAYKSIYESFIHAGAVNECKVRITPIHSEKLEVENVVSTLQGYDGILVAPGFGERGIQGKIEAVRMVREKKIPFFGICLGMQCAAVEFGKNVLKIKDAASTEVNPKTGNPIIHLMPDQIAISNKGGTMRLGSYKCKLAKGSLAHKIYGKQIVEERHRHRYEFNNDYLAKFETAGLVASGINPETGLVEIVELTHHPYFVGVQFHPELKSTVENPHPLFVAFVKAALDYRKQKNS